VADNPDTQDQSETTQESTVSLAERAKRYCDETERVVRTIGEHPQFELKRALDLSNLRQRIEFVKDIQSIATSEIASEKFSRDRCGRIDPPIRTGNQSARFR